MAAGAANVASATTSAIAGVFIMIWLLCVQTQCVSADRGGAAAVANVTVAGFAAMILGRSSHVMRGAPDGNGPTLTRLARSCGYLHQRVPLCGGRPIRSASGAPVDWDSGSRACYDLCQGG